MLATGREQAGTAQSVGGKGAVGSIVPRSRDQRLKEPGDQSRLAIPACRVAT